MTINLMEPILDRLDKIRDRCPQLRFGQLIATIGMLAEDETGQSLWDVEDADFAAALERFAADLARRQPSEAELGTALDCGGLTSPTTKADEQEPIAR